MFRLWVRLFRDNHLLRDLVVEDDGLDSRTKKIRRAIDKACEEFDLPRPIWLKSTVEEFRTHDRCRFTRDAFIEDVEFDFMDIQVLSEGD
ncbi:MAG: hypothetical protein K5696_02870 [Lachnospiraceae bacterium]|nr:hypothetical protein [Lachnospiraceae bacterium]